MLRRLHVPLRKPEDVKPHLAEPERHWRAGYSAQELASSWSAAGKDFPPEVKLVLRSCPVFANAELVDGFFEREVDLGTPGRNSQTDLMVVVGIGNELGIIAVEGKVDEPFGQLVSEWNDGSPGKLRRLSGLCSTLGLKVENMGHLRYQLLHRTASAVYEAKRYRCRHALMLVHSFSSNRKWLSDFVSFADAMAIGVSSTVSISKVCEGVNVRLAWVSDKLAHPS